MTTAFGEVSGAISCWLDDSRKPHAEPPCPCASARSQIQSSQIQSQWGWRFSQLIWHLTKSQGRVIQAGICDRFDHARVAQRLRPVGGKSYRDRMLVTGWQQALTVLVIVIPGFVHQIVRSRLRGPTPEDGDLGVRVLRALTTSGLFALIYLIALGQILTSAISHPRSYLDHPRSTALLLFALVFLIPAGVAVAQHARNTRRLYPNVSWKQVFRVYNPTPTAWDFAVNRVGPGYVRVLSKDGNWVGGYAGEDSFYTNFPQSREIFVETAWRLDEQGKFEKPIAGSAGQWIKCDDAPVIEFLRPQDTSRDRPAPQDEQADTGRSEAGGEPQ